MLWIENGIYPDIAPISECKIVLWLAITALRTLTQLLELVLRLGRTIIVAGNILINSSHPSNSHRIRHFRLWHFFMITDLTN